MVVKKQEKKIVNLRNIWQDNMKSKLVDVISKLIAKKKGVNRTGYSMYQPGLRWKGKAKDYPGAKEIINMNAQGVTGKKKRKFWIV